MECHLHGGMVYVTRRSLANSQVLILATNLVLFPDYCSLEMRLPRCQCVSPSCFLRQMLVYPYTLPLFPEMWIRSHSHFYALVWNPKNWLENKNGKGMEMGLHLTWLGLSMHVVCPKCVLVYMTSPCTTAQYKLGMRPTDISKLEMTSDVIRHTDTYIPYEAISHITTPNDQL